MFLREYLPLNLELESVSEPLSIQILLNHPVIFVIYLYRGQSRLLTLGDHVGFCLGKNIDMEHIVNSPSWRKLEVISQV